MYVGKKRGFHTCQRSSSTHRTHSTSTITLYRSQGPARITVCSSAITKRAAPQPPTESLTALSCPRPLLACAASVCVAVSVRPTAVTRLGFLPGCRRPRSSCHQVSSSCCIAPPCVPTGRLYSLPMQAARPLPPPHYFKSSRIGKRRLTDCTYLSRHILSLSFFITLMFSTLTMRLING